MTRPATTMRRLVGPLLLVATVAIIAAACNKTGPSAYGASASTAATTAAATATNAATIKGFSFQPEVLKVKVGAKVTWTNDDTVAHTVTADTNSFASGISSREARSRSRSPDREPTPTTARSTPPCTAASSSDDPGAARRTIWPSGTRWGGAGRP